MTKTVKNYRNDATGELAPPHILGTDSQGRTLYQSVDGWTPVDGDGNEVAVECDRDGSWIAESARPPERCQRP
jgi:hypothetical protein